MEKVSVIIPCFNDGDRIIEIVNEIKKSTGFFEIIIIDDGSDAKTKAVLSSINSIQLITHEKNMGKSQALLSGVKLSNNDALLFIDADLQNFNSDHVESLIKTFFSKNYDMVLGLRENELWLTKSIGFAQAYTGERIVRKSRMMNHLEIFNAGNYLIEPAINKLFFHNHKVGAVTLKDLGQKYKIQKRGLFGLVSDFKMYKDYYDYLGMKELFFQMRFAKRSDVLT